MSKVIAVVRLAQGQVAFYDEISGIHLTLGNPIAEIFDYTNTTRIRNAVANKILTLVTGSFTVENPVIVEPVAEEIVETTEAPIEVKAKAKIIEVEEPIVTEEAVEIEEYENEEDLEEVLDETAIEEKTELNIKPKNKRKKREE